MNKTLSEILQDRAGTSARNKAIKFRWEHDKTRGIQAEMARQYHISKQAIHQIINNPNVITAYHQTSPNQRQAFYLKKLMGYISQKLQDIF